MSDTTTSRTRRQRFTPQGAVPMSYRRQLYLQMMLGALIFINPLLLYRFPGIADQLYLQQWFGFADLWAGNDVGGSVAELFIWTVAFLPSYDTIWGISLTAGLTWLIAIPIAIFCFWYAYRVGYNVWLARRAFNSWVIVFQVIKKAAFIGGPVALVMIALSEFAGMSFSILNIIEIASWIVILVLGAVVAAGRLWNRDIRRDSGVLGTNATMGDSNDFEEVEPEEDR